MEEWLEERGLPRTSPSMSRTEGTAIEQMSRTTPIPSTSSIRRENGAWRTSKLKEYPDALCSYIARLFQQWLVSHKRREAKAFDEAAEWLSDLIIQEDDAITSFGPDFAH